MCETDKLIRITRLPSNAISFLLKTIIFLNCHSASVDLHQTGGNLRLVRLRLLITVTSLQQTAEVETQPRAPSEGMQVRRRGRGDSPILLAVRTRATKEQLFPVLQTPSQSDQAAAFSGLQRIRQSASTYRVTPSVQRSHYACRSFSQLHEHDTVFKIVIR